MRGNFFTGRRANIAHLIQHPHFELQRHDVIIPLYVEVDEIYNLACPASPIHYQYDPVQTTKTSVHGAINMLGLARRVGARILQASTSEVYGDPTEHPQTETYWGNVNPVGPRGCYDEAKRFAEAITMSYHRHHGLETRIMRIFNTYGPRMRLDDGRVLPAFIGQALRDEALTVFGDGSQTRSFCYVDDLLEGAYRLMKSDEVFPINIGNPGEMTILEFAERVQESLGVSREIIHQELPEDDPKVRRPNIDKAKRILDWEPTIALAEGLQMTIPFFKEVVGQT